MEKKILVLKELSNSFFKDLEVLLSLDKKELSVISSHFNKAQSLDIEDLDESSLIQETELSREKLESILEIIEYLYFRTHIKAHSNATKLIDELKDLPQLKDFDLVTNEPVLKDIFTKKTSYELKKLRNIQYRIGNNLLTKSYITVSIRPIYDVKDEEILDYLPLGSITLETIDVQGELNSTTFHVKKENIDVLLTELKKLKKQIEKIELDFESKLKIN